MPSKSGAKTKAKKTPKRVKSAQATGILTHRISVFATGFLAAAIFIIALSFVLVRINQTFAANFADNVLRPVIGNTATIKIESLFFGVEDNVNKVKYALVKPTPVLFTQVSREKSIYADYSNSFSLNRITSLSYFSLFPGEGQWSPIYNGSSEAYMEKTFVRPDPQRPYAVVSLVKMDMSHLSINAVAGTREPGGTQNPGPGKVPEVVQKSNDLVAAFNGGFQQKDGHYGMIVNGKTYLPLKKGLATLVIYNGYKPQIVDYEGQSLGQNVVTIRQNGPMLLENGQDVTSSSAWNMQTWGLTITNSMYTWRSGIGVTKNGNLIYAVGPSLVPETLAAALKAAGAVDAMQLDINPVWVRFVVFTPLGNGQYNYYPLTKDMTNGGYQDLTGYQKDFFYLIKK